MNAIEFILNHQIVDLKLILLIVVLFIIDILSFFNVYIKTKKVENSKNFKNITQNNSYINLSKLEISLFLINFLIYIFLILNFKFKIVFLFLSLSLIIKNIHIFLMHINHFYKKMVERDRFSFQTKISLLVICSIFLFYPLILNFMFSGTFIIENDFLKVIFIIFYFSLKFFGIFTILGILIGDFSRYILFIIYRDNMVNSLNKKLWDIRLLSGFNYHKKLIEKMNQFNNTFHIPFLLLIYICEYIMLIQVYFFTMMLYMIIDIVDIITKTLRYLAYFILLLLRNLSRISDKKFIVTCIWLSIIFGISVTEIMIINEKVVSASFRMIYEFFSQTILIPLLISGLLTIKNFIVKSEFKC